MDSARSDEAPPAALPRAVGWLRDLLQSEFTVAPDFTRAAGTPSLPRPATQPDPTGDEAAWKRTWLKEWRRLQLPDEFAAFTEALAEARTPGAVYTALTEHAVRIVGAYTALLFLPEGDDALRPLPNPRLRVDAGRFTLSPSPLVSCTGLVETRDATAGSGPFATFAPLFEEERAVSLARVPFRGEGVLFLVERRRARVFDAEDLHLLRGLAVQAEAALDRVRLFQSVGVLSGTDPLTGMAAGERLEEVLEHACAAARRGKPLSLVRLALPATPSADAPLLRTAARALRAEARGRGVAVRAAAGELLLVLPEADGAEAGGVATRVLDALGRPTGAEAGVAAYRTGLDTPAALLRAVREAPARATHR